MAKREIEAEVSCPVCWAKCGQPCVGDHYGQGLDFNNAHGGVMAEPHPERVARWESFADRPRWPCHKEDCNGSRKAISSGEMGSSTEGGCSDCDWWIDDPANCITSDEMLRDMAPDLLETHQLVDNPAGPKTNLEITERPSGPVLIGEPDNPDAQLHLVPRTEPPEFNPLRQPA